MRERNAFEEEGLFRAAGNDGGAGVAAFEGECTLVEAEAGLGFGFIRAVAGEAVFRKDGLDPGGEFNLGWERESDEDRK